MSIQDTPPDEPVAWAWYYDSVGRAVVNKLVVTEKPEAPVWLANMFPRGPFPLYTRATPVLSDEQIEDAALKATMARIYQVGGDPKLPIVPASKAWRREFYSAILAATKQDAEQGKTDL